MHEKIFQERKLYLIWMYSMPVACLFDLSEKCVILAKYWIGESIELADNAGFTARELKEIETIVLGNKSKLKEAWNEFFTE